MLPVFSSGAHHGGAADVDVFNRVFQCAAGLGHGGGKGVEVHAHQVDIADVVLGHFVHMRGQIAAPQNTAVDFGVQGFHAPVEHFRKAGVIGHFNHRNTGIGQQFGGAAGRQQFHAHVCQRTGKIHHAGFVRHA